ncbi:DUF1223 domain-containing protein [Devosia submarina]|uniref:DUF1223 domain-containing protein n=1 Tax=Devosia submarina TaxID=1173082 RepID=UPI000D3633D1|nr:DUF1223 domain-containing protein [Devosia submarina]
MTKSPFLRMALGLVALGLLAAPAGAESMRARPKAVVELFTSQGCSSCPPADALLTGLAEDQDVIALAYHVDYWDYVGWKDTFAHAEFSDRQRAYAESWGSSRIYTPQMVVNGQKGVVGSRRNDVHRAIDGAALPLPVDISRHDKMLKIAIPPRAGLADAVVWLVTYLDRSEIAIDKGENAGKTMVYTQVVTGRQVLGMWESGSGASLKLPIPEVLAETSTGIAVLVQQEQDGLPGPILGAAAFEP